MKTADMLTLYRRMVLIRRIEERLGDEAAAGTVPGVVHLCIGQEAIAVGVCELLRDDDQIVSYHRGHGHFLAKGGDPKEMMAEIWMKRTGVCKGMGGSSHVADFSKGIIGATGIVGSGLAIATGAAFAAQLRGRGQVAVVFFGDGAAGQGTFMECLNISTLWKLPVVFVCENNSLCQFTRTASITHGNIVDRARVFGIPCHVVDGNDVLAVRAAAESAIERARSGDGPSFLEAHTYRLRGHFEAESRVLDGATYREEREIEEWRGRDPIARIKIRLIESEEGRMGIEWIDADITRIVQESVEFAIRSGAADVELAGKLMFVGHTP